MELNLVMSANMHMDIFLEAVSRRETYMEALHQGNIEQLRLEHVYWEGFHEDDADYTDAQRCERRALRAEFLRTGTWGGISLNEPYRSRPVSVALAKSLPCEVLWLHSFGAFKQEEEVRVYTPDQQWVARMSNFFSNQSGRKTLKVAESMKIDSFFQLSVWSGPSAVSNIFTADMLSRWPRNDRFRWLPHRGRIRVCVEDWKSAITLLHYLPEFYGYGFFVVVPYIDWSAVPYGETDENGSRCRPKCRYFNRDGARHDWIKEATLMSVLDVAEYVSVGLDDRSRERAVRRVFGNV